jgi:hypothetical protein
MEKLNYKLLLLIVLLGIIIAAGEGYYCGKQHRDPIEVINNAQVIRDTVFMTHDGISTDTSFKEPSYPVTQNIGTPVTMVKIGYTDEPYRVTGGLKAGHVYIDTLYVKKIVILK